MLKILLRHKIRFLVGCGLVASLAIIRAYEYDLFYDPFLNYFEGDFQHQPLPFYDTLPLFFSLVLRYGLNMFISLALIYVIFKEVQMIKFTFFLYLLFFMFLLFCFFGIIHIYGSSNNLMLFYTRRFLIQPLFVLLFIPAFYYQKQTK